MRLYGWGANSYGQLGLGSKVESVLEPQEVTLDDSGLLAENIVEVCGGVGHTLALDTNGRVYSCGSNAMGQLGISENTLRFKQIEVLAGYRIMRISCGWDFSAAVTNCGKLFVWGNNAHLQLGLQKHITSMSTPARVPSAHMLARGFSNVACGMRHMAMLTNDGGMLVAGTGSQGALGTGSNYDDGGYISIWKLRTVKQVRDIACGQNHTVCLKADGTVLCWGENRHGQLGMDPARSNVFVPTEVFRRAGLVSVAAGWTHTVALSTVGEVFNWGRNNCGQLGAVRKETHLAMQLTDIGTVAQITCGWQHTLARTSDAKLFAWGSNEHGNCGNGDAANVANPRQVLAGHKVKVGFACAGHSFAVVK